MTSTEREIVERDVIFEADKSKRNYELHRAKLAMIGDKLVELGRALQKHPELVTPTPEIDALDYRESLDLMNSRQAVIDQCQELRELNYRMKITAQRKSMLGFD